MMAAAMAKVFRICNDYEDLSGELGNDDNDDENDDDEKEGR